jgi:hypothetical protein
MSTVHLVNDCSIYLTTRILINENSRKNYTLIGMECLVIKVLGANAICRRCV